MAARRHHSHPSLRCLEANKVLQGFGKRIGEVFGPGVEGWTIAVCRPPPNLF